MGVSCFTCLLYIGRRRRSYYLFLFGPKFQLRQLASIASAFLVCYHKARARQMKRNGRKRKIFWRKKTAFKKLKRGPSAFPWKQNKKPCCLENRYSEKCLHPFSSLSSEKRLLLLLPLLFVIGQKKLRPEYFFLFSAPGNWQVSFLATTNILASIFASPVSGREVS